MLQVLKLTGTSGILTGADSLAVDLLRLFGIDDKQLMQRTCRYELLSSIAGTALTIHAWREDDLSLRETVVYELTLPGKEQLEVANEVAKLFGLGDFRGVTRMQLEVEVGRLADLTVSFEPRKAVETVGSTEFKFTAKEVGYAKIA